MSSKGKTMITLDGFSYHKSSSYKEKTYWSCEMRKDEVFKCKATLSTNAQLGLVSFGAKDHNHNPNALRKPLAEAFFGLKVIL